MQTSPPSTATMPAGRLRVGECTVDFALREILAPSARRPRRVTPKAIAVLGVLIEQGGRVVSRDALLAQVWPGTLPTNDVVTQAVTQLRKAFDDERGNPSYIETIAKHGYRLLAEVEALEELPPAPVLMPRVTGEVASLPAQAPVPPLPPPPRVPVPPTPPVVRGSWRAIAAALGVAVAVAAAVLGWATLREPSPPAPVPAPSAATRSLATPAVQMITSVPGAETSPTLSPDSALVAYVAVPAGERRTAILVQTTSPSPPRQLTHPGDDAADQSPAWSPDGRDIAFLRVVPDRECRVLVVPASGGNERNVGVCDPRNPPSFDWTHDGRGLVFGSRGVPGGTAGLRVLDLASGAWRPIEYGATAQDVDYAPHYSPDGRWIVFVRNAPAGDLWRIPATGGTPQRLTRMHGDIRGWDWTPDGRGIVLARWHHSESRLLRLDLASGLLQDLGLPDSVEPVMAAAGTQGLAFVEAVNYYGVHRAPLDDQEATGGEHLFASSGRDRLPAVAPDGQQLVFTSSRAGSFGLWWADLRAPESLRLIEGLQPESWHLPDWSRDSRRLLVVGEGPGGQGAFEVTPASGRVVRLPIPAANIIQAMYVPDAPGRLLVLAAGDTGRLRLHLYDRTVTPWRELAGLDGVAVARTDPRNLRVLFTRAGEPGLWQGGLDLAPASLRQLDPLRPEVSRFRAWGVGEDGSVLLLQRTRDCASAIRRLGDDSAPVCVDRQRRAGPQGFSVAPRGDAIFITVSLWDGGDIGYLPLPSPPEEAGPG
ncbi:winged helix-turn-helix domain-containing protein [Agrilutibacter solisilvae]|uniref:PD40 domain-containing protein n=1 Tax=Agrilutibacter solisilvae TaxID=2763317 RepID=A0A975ATN7_9GAMM|nr:winged helix-turn-helix domain-containing protein [Lysobacter solisilvae]QSX79508.1 PD40 domain-containing protein [Lysobacter solisilvae]